MPRLTAYRIFYGKKGGIWSFPQELVFGKAELERVLARKRPRAIHYEKALIHTCDVCGTEGPWTGDWSPVPAEYRAGQSFWSRDRNLKACSDACRNKQAPGWAPDRWMQEDNEPLHLAPERIKQARWDAFRAEEDRRRGTTAHRKCPMPNDTKGDGWCRWCGKEVEPPRRTWHKECLREYMLHSSSDAQFRFLRQRDGDLCANGDCGRPGAEVDHRVPLWSIRHLPEKDRIRYYGPGNIWLLCLICHKAKSKREAAERAAMIANSNDSR